MENGNVSIRVFEVLDQIRKDHKIKTNDWAVAAYGHKKYQSRISELRRKLRLSDFSEQDDVGRAFSSSKCMALLNGLIKLLGGDIMAKELIKLLEKAKTKKERMLLLVMAAQEVDEDVLLMFIEKVVVKDKKS